MAAPKLVVIDDEVEFIKTLKAFFGTRGYDVRVALSGPSGMRVVEEERPDVVLVDLKLPGLDGDQVLTQIRRKQPRTKVIVITGYNDGGKTRDRVLALGAYAHFYKALTSLRELSDCVKQALAATP